MLTWVVVGVTAVVAVGVLVLLLVREPVVRPDRVEPVAGPDGVRRSFRWAWPGYDPAQVDAHLAAIDHAWREGLREELEEGGGDGAGGLDG